MREKGDQHSDVEDCPKISAKIATTGRTDQTTVKEGLKTVTFLRMDSQASERDGSLGSEDSLDVPMLRLSYLQERKTS